MATVTDPVAGVEDVAALLGSLVGRTKLYLLDTNDFAKPQLIAGSPANSMGAMPRCG